MVIHLIPGDAAAVLAGPNATPEALAAIRHDMGLDQPLLVQYLVWMGHVLQGDLGKSTLSGQPISKLLQARAPATHRAHRCRDGALDDHRAAAWDLERGPRSRQDRVGRFDGSEPVSGHPELLGWHSGHHFVLAHPALASARRPRRGRQRHRRLDQVADPAGDDASAWPSPRVCHVS